MAEWLSISTYAGQIRQLVVQSTGTRVVWNLCCNKLSPPVSRQERCVRQKNTETWTFSASLLIHFLFSFLFFYKHANHIVLKGLKSGGERTEGRLRTQAAWRLHWHTCCLSAGERDALGKTVKLFCSLSAFCAWLMFLYHMKKSTGRV